VVGWTTVFERCFLLCRLFGRGVTKQFSDMSSFFADISKTGLFCIGLEGFVGRPWRGWGVSV
jgi:hypothetical protein